MVSSDLLQEIQNDFGCRSAGISETKRKSRKGTITERGRKKKKKSEVACRHKKKCSSLEAAAHYLNTALQHL